MVIKNGSKVKVDYEGRLESGEIFDTSNHGDHSHPLEFVVGQGQVIRGFEEGIKGMEKGEEKEIEILPENAYGQPNPELKKEVPRNLLPKDREPKEGMTLMLSTPQGQQFPAKIEKITEDKIVLDLNHPLAGKKLIFKIKVLEVEEPENPNSEA